MSIPFDARKARRILPLAALVSLHACVGFIDGSKKDTTSNETTPAGQTTETGNNFQNAPPRDWFVSTSVPGDQTVWNNSQAPQGTSIVQPPDGTSLGGSND